MKILGAIVYFSLGFLLLPSGIFAQEQKELPSVFFKVGNPVIVSVSNKEGDGEMWALDASKDNSISVTQKKMGYLFTYFTLQINNPKTTAISFNTPKGKHRVFPLKIVSESSPLGEQIYGDIPSLNPSAGFLTQMDKASYTPANLSTSSSSLVLPETPSESNGNNMQSLGSTPNPLLDKESDSNITPTQEIGKEEDKKTLDPVLTKQYIQKLLDNGLIPQAREVFEQLVTQPSIDTNWKYITDLKISKLGNNYQDVLDKSSQMLSKEIPSKDTELSLRQSQAMAMEKLEKLDEAQAALLYNTLYFPSEVSTYTNLIDFYLRHQNTKKALEQLLFVASHFQDMEDLDKIYYQIAYCYYNLMGKEGYNLALEYYKKILAFGPSSPYYQKSKSFVDFLENNLLNYH